MTPLTDAEIAEMERLYADATMSMGCVPLKYTHYDPEVDGHWSTIRFAGGAVICELPHKREWELRAQAMVAIVNAAPQLLASAREASRMRPVIDAALQWRLSGDAWTAGARLKVFGEAIMAYADALSATAPEDAGGRK